MDNNLEIEVEVSNVKAAKSRVAEIRDAFGEDVFISVKISGEDKSKVFATLNDAIVKTADEIKAKLRREKE